MQNQEHSKKGRHLNATYYAARTSTGGSILHLTLSEHWPDVFFFLKGTVVRHLFTLTGSVSHVPVALAENIAFVAHSLHRAVCSLPCEAALVLRLVTYDRSWICCFGPLGASVSCRRWCIHMLSLYFTRDSKSIQPNFLRLSLMWSHFSFGRLFWRES